MTTTTTPKEHVMAGYGFYVAVQGTYTSRKDVTLDRTEGALVYPSKSREGAEKHAATLTATRNYSGPTAVVVQVTNAPGAPQPRIGRDAMVAFLTGNPLIGSPKLPAGVRAAVTAAASATRKAEATKAEKPKASATRKEAEKVPAADEIDEETAELIAMGEALQAEAANGRRGSRATK